MADPKRYLIEHVSDLVKVPEKRRAACLRELGSWLKMIDHFNVLLTPEGCDPPAWRSFTWIDDGQRNVKVTVSVKEPPDPSCGAPEAGTKQGAVAPSVADTAPK